MTQALTSITAKMGLLLQGDKFVSSTSTGGSTSTLIDTGRLQDDVRGTFYKKSWVYLTANTDPDRFRRVITDTPATGTLTLSSPVLSATAAAKAYQAWPTYSPRFAIACLNNAIEKLQLIEESTFSVGTDGVRQFLMATDAAWLVDPDFQVFALDLQGGTSGKYTYTPVADAVFTTDQGVVTLNFNGATYKTTDVLRLRTLRTIASASMSGVALSAGTDTAVIPATADALAWLAAEACLEMIEIPYDSWQGSESQTERTRTEARVRAAVGKWRARFVRRPPRKLWATTGSRFGPVGTGI